MLLIARNHYKLTPEPDQHQTDGREIGDDDQRQRKQGEKRQCRPVKGNHRLVKTVAGEKEIQADRRCAIADLQVGQKNDAQVNKINAVGLGDRNYDRYDKDQGGKNIKHRAYNEEKNIQQQQESIFA